MITQMKNNHLVEEVQHYSLKEMTSSDMIDNKNLKPELLPEKILQAIYPENSSIMPVHEAQNIIIWYSDQSFSKSLQNKINVWRKNSKTIHLINCGVNSSFGAPGVHEYFIKKHTEGALALGYMNEVFNRKGLIPAFVSEQDKPFFTFKEMIKTYNLERVKEITGLTKKEITAIYNIFQAGFRPYHWLALSERSDERTIQSIRSICLLPAAQLNEKENIKIPVSYEQDPFEKAFAVIPKEGSYPYKLIPKSELFLSENKRSAENFNLPSGLKKSLVSFYDWDFADYFDVDPLPSWDHYE